MDELEIASAHSVTNLMYLQPRAVDDFRYISEMPKMKIYNLVVLMHKDSRTDIGILNAISAQCRLEEINRNKKDAIEYRNGEDNLAKYAVKLVLPKFNNQLNE